MMSTKHSSKGDGAPLTDKLLAAIANHLNQDHCEDLLACAKAQVDWAEQARVLSLDAAGIQLEVSGNGQTQPLRIDFPETANGVLTFKKILGTVIVKSRSQLRFTPVEESDS
ncbi:DUF2470 domain-containing protein (plasmid) [Acaryochloris sp. 'Moss Beach']|uniref:DUF2470 domain-containing protein n=1 Tax=Acaryochloris sp. 'Moss Beach' TaxID=2740837 RepID=UPI001F343DE1|nr:DUF2470 domain-containing protein [Acaryochloris sp. 'Moss Beach']UJB72234.1 DUF2470 domain-containing protein [Acaryochloris sp. 'Moss Beach']